jgi:hypothetical protein
LQRSDSTAPPQAAASAHSTSAQLASPYSAAPVAVAVRCRSVAQAVWTAATRQPALEAAQPQAPAQASEALRATEPVAAETDIEAAETTESATAAFV